jgi:predicted nucleotidyltransferase
MAHYSEEISGTIIEKIRTEIQSIQRELCEVSHVYGFGSFFRGEDFDDIDVLFVVTGGEETLLNTSRAIRRKMAELSKALGYTIDTLVLTKREMAEKPLRDMSSLRLFSNKTS